MLKEHNFKLVMEYHRRNNKTNIVLLLFDWLLYINSCVLCNIFIKAVAFTQVKLFWISSYFFICLRVDRIRKDARGIDIGIHISRIGITVRWLCT